jgi:hypothetical protein
MSALRSSDVIGASRWLEALDASTAEAESSTARGNLGEIMGVPPERLPRLPAGKPPETF